ncbi:MAG: endonuclease III [Anaerolineales bacterium]
MLRRISAAVAPYPKAAMFELAELGYETAFQQLVACIISIRTFDEVSLPAAQRLFKQAPTAQAVAALAENEIDKLIYPATFHERKAAQIRAIARTVVEEHGGKLPCDRELMLSFSGVGPKCANLAMGVACGESVISVDIHVHRVTNRWGYVATKKPEKTIEALEAVLPKKHWIDINKLLVPFGKHICTGQRPKCSMCPVLEYCRQVGVPERR